MAKNLWESYEAIWIEIIPQVAQKESHKVV